MACENPMHEGWVTLPHGIRCTPEIAAHWPETNALLAARMRAAAEVVEAAGPNLDIPMVANALDDVAGLHDLMSTAIPIIFPVCDVEDETIDQWAREAFDRYVVAWRAQMDPEQVDRDVASMLQGLG